jgi:hypothetical protein
MAASDKKAAAAAPDPKPAPQEAPPPAPPPEPATRLYTTLMGLSLPRGGSYAYLPGGEMVELTVEQAEPLLANGAIEPAK